jgi:hypothetical protein
MPRLTELENLFSAGYYKDAAPTALGQDTLGSGEGGRLLYGSTREAVWK